MLNLFRITFICFSIAFFSQATLANNKTEARSSSYIVQNGQIKNVAYQGNIWIKHADYLQGEGKRNPLLSSIGIGPGDFIVTAKLRILDQKKSGTSFMLDGNHFGFEGSQEEVFVNGKKFGGLKKIVKSKDVFPRGTWFDFRITRKNANINYYINDQPIYNFHYGNTSIQKIGFYPLRGTIQLKDYKIEGNLITSNISKTSLTFTPVFSSGLDQDGYSTFRIPSLVTTKSGTLLAFAEGRATRDDHSQNDIVIKRSTDNGATWSKTQTLIEDGKHCISNPTAVVLNDSRILLMYTRYQYGYAERNAVEGYDAEGVVRAFIIFSSDDGTTWSTPKEITRSVKRPTIATSIAPGPGRGIQLRRGKYKNRILIPFNQGPFGDWKVYAAYSDDGGTNWQYGNLARTSNDTNANEVQFVELTDGSIMLNSRMMSKDGSKFRGIARSIDGGQTWSNITYDKTLIEPRCQGSILRISDPLDRQISRIVFSNPASKTKRINGTVRLSYDDGRTWPAVKQLWSGTFAYSCLTKLKDDSIGCFFETWVTDTKRPKHDQIVYQLMYARFPLGWISQQQAGIPTSSQLKHIDISSDKTNQVIIDKEDGQYLGHPTTVLLENNKTMLTVYPKGHGRGQIVLKRSHDGGQTWSKSLPVPKSWSTGKECPSIHRVIDRDGKRRLILFSGLYPIRMSTSEDDGQTWTELSPIGEYGGIVAMSSVAKISPGKYMAFFHDDGMFLNNDRIRSDYMVYSITSEDGGLTWSNPNAIASLPNAELCEPGVLRSPESEELMILLRENSRNFHSFMIRSSDNGESWSEPTELPASLTGDKHVARYTPDGRLVVVFRDMALGSKTWGDFVAWVGTYHDIVNGRDGQYRIRLLDNKSNPYDTGYAGLEVLTDGTLVATTYCVLKKGDKPLIVSKRFNLKDLDKTYTESSF
ncbi:exo-alpha-sialidase [Poriferisphaera sp. WC338]|uniref:exo-alpha-sialidase n=1 Tax=Poriferisphaera sp. WC338 TaxID=3425129 RepID=UPI003D81975F